MRLATVGMLLGMLVTAFSPVAARSTPSDMFDFEAVDLEGQPFRGESLRGKTVLVDFWAVWCAPCIKAFPRLSELQDELGSDRFQVLGIAAYSGGPAQVKKFLRDKAVRYRVVVADADLVEHFQVIGYPTYLLIGPDGTIRETFVGDLNRFYDEIRELVAGSGDPAEEEK